MGAKSFHRRCRIVPAAVARNDLDFVDTMPTRIPGIRPETRIFFSPNFRRTQVPGASHDIGALQLVPTLLVPTWWRRGDQLRAHGYSCVGASMKPRHPNVEWIKKVLADIESDRGDPQIAALIDRHMGGRVEISSQPARGLEAAQDPFGALSSPAGH